MMSATLVSSRIGSCKIVSSEFVMSLALAEERS